MTDRIIEYGVWTVAAVSVAYFGGHVVAYLIG
jgi:hypothetical protein